MKSFRSSYTDTTRINIVNTNFQATFFYYSTLFSFSDANFAFIHIHEGVNKLEIMWKYGLL